MKQVMRNLIRKGRQTELVWRYGFNAMPSLRYRLSSSPLSDPCMKKVISNLNRDGIAITSVNELLSDLKYFDELETVTGALLESRSDELREMQLQASDTGKIGEKTFNVELLGSEVDFDPDSTFARFALQDTLLNIANAYYGMLAKLRYYNVWYTFATAGAARESQLWHFDREDNYILKVFVYLKDVDEGTGPLSYAPGTHRSGKLWGRQPEFFLENNVRRSTDEQMSKVVPEKDWIKAVGAKGTIVFADTRGFHKGGEARTSDRLMYTCMFTSPSSDSRRLLKYSREKQPLNLTKQQLCALEIR